jgi:hypothetical protein
MLQERGLLPPMRRYGRSDDIAFHREHLERLHAVGRGLSMGFAVDELAAILSAAGLVTCNDVYTVAQAAVERLRREGADETAPIVARLRTFMEGSPRVGSKLSCPIYLEIMGLPPKRSPRGGRRRPTA